jgi:hypothetical protein
MLSRKVFWSVTLILALVGATSGALLGNHLASGTVYKSHAAWKEIFDSAPRLAQGVDAVVLAKAVSVAPGRVVMSANGKDGLPFQVYQFEVVRGVKGVAAGETIQIERAGGVAPDGRQVVLDVDGGAYEIGGTYLLFLNRQEDGPYFYQVNAQGRYLVDDHRLWSVDPHDNVSAFFEGRSVKEGVALVREYVREGRPAQ